MTPAGPTHWSELFPSKWKKKSNLWVKRKGTNKDSKSKQILKKLESMSCFNIFTSYLLNFQLLSISCFFFAITRLQKQLCAADWGQAWWFALADETHMSQRRGNRDADQLPASHQLRCFKETAPRCNLPAHWDVLCLQAHLYLLLLQKLSFSTFLEATPFFPKEQSTRGLGMSPVFVQIKLRQMWGSPAGHFLGDMHIIVPNLWAHCLL